MASIITMDVTSLVNCSAIPEPLRKRRRACSSTAMCPITPPGSPDECPADAVLAGLPNPAIPGSTSAMVNNAIRVLAVEATALAHVRQLYSMSAEARTALAAAIEAMVAAQAVHGKVIVCGIGKSAYVGMKLVATMKSLGIACSFLHAAEALHGDLGDVRPVDVMLFISYSSKTPELCSVVQHIPSETPVIALTGHSDPATCPLIADRPGAILLPAPIPESEEESFGVSAPTASTTVAMAVGDMLALTVADVIHEGKSGTVFKKFHPGGAIGARNS